VNSTRKKHIYNFRHVNLRKFNKRQYDLNESEKVILSKINTRLNHKIKDLYIVGEFKNQDMTALAVVGSRQASEYGKKVCEKFVSQLALAGITIVSGAMYGIDMCAHKSALSVGGRTIAVLAYGFNHIKNFNYAKHVVKEILKTKSGVVVSEMKPSEPAQKWSFPRRNRIIAGLSKAVLVIEAGSHSGSLITVDHALNQGKDVFVIPGSIFHPNSKGKHKLIKEGAILVDSPKEIIEYLR